jgi:hypothetical protein
MSSRSSSRSFDGSAARNLRVVPASEQAPAEISSGKTPRTRETSAASTLPAELKKAREQRDAEEVSKIRQKIEGKKAPSPGVNALLAIEHAKSLLSSGDMMDEDLARTRTELLTAKQILENAVLKARTQGNEESATEYFDQIQEIETLLDETHTPAEAEETVTGRMMKENAGKNAVKLADYALEKRDAVQEKIQPVLKELKEAKAKLQKALLDEDLMEDDAKRMQETMKSGGWNAFKLRIGDSLRQLRGSPSILDLQKKIEDLELKKDLMRGEMAEFTGMAHSSQESTAGYQTTLKRPKTSKAELRREEARRDDRIESGKSAEELEKEYLGEAADNSIEVDLSELEEEEPITLVKIKKPKKESAPSYDVDLSELEADEEPITLVRKKELPTVDVKLPKEILELAKKGAKKLERGVDLFTNISIDEAQALLPNAEKLWDLVNNELKSLKKQDSERFRKFVDAFQPSQDAASTKFVFEAARLEKARTLGADERSIKMIQNRLEDAAGQLGLHDSPMFLRMSDSSFNDALNRIPHADQLIQLINTRTGMDNSYVGVTPATRNYLVAMGEYRKMVDEGNILGQNEAWEKVSEMNSNLGIEGNALVQSLIGETKRPQDVMRGTKQRRESVERSNKRNKF